ncbi:MAG: hypothetical protein ACR2N3_12570 [Pyrinomonadaceae bacterium]
MPTAVCPECGGNVYVDAEAEQGDVLACEECGADLEVVGLDPIELDIYEAIGSKDDADDYEDDRY